MNVTREIVKDLLPLYAAGEASPESRTAVEEWLRTDPELARVLVALRDDAAPQAVPPTTPSVGQTTLATTKGLMCRRTWLLASALFVTGLPFSFVVGDEGLRFLMIRDAPGVSTVYLAVALTLWCAYGIVVRRLRVTGL